MITAQQIVRRVSERYQELKPKAKRVGQRIDFQALVREQILAAGYPENEISDTVREVNQIFARMRKAWAEKRRKAS